MKTTSINNLFAQRERQIIASLSLALTLLVALYGFFMIMAVRGAMSQRASFRENQTLAKEIASLEAAYGSLRKTITADRAEEFGLVPLESSRFASREDATRLTLAGDVR